MDRYQRNVLPIKLNGKVGVQTLTGFILSILILSLTVSYGIYELFIFAKGQFPIISETQQSLTMNPKEVTIEGIIFYQSGTASCAQITTFGSTCSSIANELAAYYNADYYCCFTINSEENMSFGQTGPFGLSIPSTANRLCLVSYSANPSNIGNPFTSYLDCVVGEVVNSNSEIIASSFVVTWQLQTINIEASILVQANVDQHNSQVKSRIIGSQPYSVSANLFTFVPQNPITYDVKPQSFANLIASISAVFSMLLGTCAIIFMYFINKDQIYILGAYFSHQPLKTRYPCSLINFLPKCFFRKLEGNRELIALNQEMTNSYLEFKNLICVKELFDQNQKNLIDSPPAKANKKRKSCPLVSKVRKIMIDFFSETNIPYILDTKQGGSTFTGKVTTTIINLITLAYACYIAAELFTQPNITNSKSQATQTVYPELGIILTSGVAPFSAGAFISCSDQFLQYLASQGETNNIECFQSNTEFLSIALSYPLSSPAANYKICYSTYLVDVSNKASPLTYAVNCVPGQGLTPQTSNDAYGTYYQVSVLTTQVEVLTDTNPFFTSQKSDKGFITEYINSQFPLQEGPVLVQASNFEFTYIRQYNKVVAIIPSILGVHTLLIVVFTLLVRPLVMMEESINFHNATKSSEQISNYSLSEYVQGFLNCKKEIRKKYSDLSDIVNNAYNLDHIFDSNVRRENAKAKIDIPYFKLDFFALQNVPFIIKGERKLSTKIGKSYSLFLVCLIFAYGIYMLSQLATNTTLTITTAPFSLNQQELTDIVPFDFGIVYIGSIPSPFTGVLLWGSAPSSECSHNIETQLLKGNYNGPVFCPLTIVSGNSEPAVSGWALCYYNQKVYPTDLESPIQSNYECLDKIMPNSPGFQANLESDYIQIITDSGIFFNTPTAPQYAVTTYLTISYPATDFFAVYHNANPIGTQYVRTTQKIPTIFATLKGIWAILLSITRVLIGKFVNIERGLKMKKYLDHPERVNAKIQVKKSSLFKSIFSKEKLREAKEFTDRINKMLDLKIITSGQTNLEERHPRDEKIVLNSNSDQNNEKLVLVPEVDMEELGNIHFITPKQVFIKRITQN